MLLAYLLMLVIDLLLLAVVAYVLLLLLPEQGAHRAGVPARPAPPQGRHEGPVKSGWQASPAPGRHESGAYPVLEAAA